MWLESSTSVMHNLPHRLQQSVCVWAGGGGPGWYKAESQASLLGPWGSPVFESPLDW